MEKNTKILLGVGAVIAAYLILKPKKYANATAKTKIFWNREAHLKFWKKIFG